LGSTIEPGSEARLRPTRQRGGYFSCQLTLI